MGICDSVPRDVADTTLGRQPTPQTDTPPGQTPPSKMATAADGTHPTGMHSCLALCQWSRAKAHRQPKQFKSYILNRHTQINTKTRLKA